LQSSPRRTRGLKKLGKQAIGKSKGGWNTKLHVVSADDKVVLEMHLSGGECHDAPEGRISIETIGEDFPGVPLLMDRAQEREETRKLASAYGHEPIVPPKKNRQNPWEYDKEKYKRRNVVERLFRRLKEFRKVYTRYDKTDIMYLAFIQFACIAI
jgi:transposase